MMAGEEVCPMARANTRDDILSAAARLFANVGFKGTSLSDIAVEVGCSKATLLYHFASKDAILVTLLAPPARDLGVLVEGLADRDAEAARGLAIEGFVDLVLAYRSEIALIRHDMAQLIHTPAFAAVKPLTDRLEAAIAGSSEPAAQVAAKVVLAGIAMVALERPELGDQDLRTVLIGVARRAMNPGI
jgi:AcrR family transcriptional regulator